MTPSDRPEIPKRHDHRASYRFIFRGSSAFVFRCCAMSASSCVLSSSADTPCGWSLVSDRPRRNTYPSLFRRRKSLITNRTASISFASAKSDVSDDDRDEATLYVKSKKSRPLISELLPGWRVHRHKTIVFSPWLMCEHGVFLERGQSLPRR